MVLSFPPKITRCIPQGNSVLFPVYAGIHPLLTKLVLFFSLFMDFDSTSVHKHTKRELDHYPAILTPRLVNNSPYYMACSASGQDESNPALLLASRAGKMELYCPLGTTHPVPQEKFP